MQHYQDTADAGEDDAGLEPIGVIDIGSNSVRLVVYEGAIRSLTPVFNEKVLCGLGRSVASTGSLASDAVERAIHALTRFKRIAHMKKLIDSGHIDGRLRWKSAALEPQL